MSKQTSARKISATGDESGVPQARLFRAMSHPARIQILRRLIKGECCVSDAESILKISQPNVSQHLKILKTAGLIAGERRGAKICYRLADRRVADLLKVLSVKENCDEECK